MAARHRFWCRAALLLDSRRSVRGANVIVTEHVMFAYAGCARRGGGLVITSDPDDIARLTAAVPAARVVTRPAR